MKFAKRIIWPEDASTFAFRSVVGGFTPTLSFR